MRLLVMVLVFSLFSIGVRSDEKRNAAPAVNSEILACLEGGYKKVDGELNNIYRRIKGDQSFAEKDILAGAEEAWVKFKELSCNYIYDSYSPGMESEIERMNCLIEVTSAQTVELLYIYTGVGGDGFYNALSVIGKGSEVGKNTFIEEIKAKVRMAMLTMKEIAA